MTTRASTVLAVWCLIAAANSIAQNQPSAFEVASIKPNNSGSAGGDTFSSSPGRLRVTDMTFVHLIQAAYHVRSGTLFGASGWMESERFDIDAKAPVAATFDQELTMLQTLLADRFQLRFHRETRPLQTLVLGVAKNGPKLQRSKDQTQKEQVTIHPTEISGTAISFGYFVSILGAQLHRPITDETGLTGKYDLSLKYVGDEVADPASGLSLFAALEQLGLKLETRKGPVEVIVIDSAERPRNN